jgi:acetyl esterase/lipase
MATPTRPITGRALACMLCALALLAALPTAARAGTPPYSELTTPPAGERVKGLVILIHGGGWTQVGPADVAYERPKAAFYNARGWMALNVDYSAGAAGFADVLRFYDLARASLGPDVPICASGESAGGTFALLLAEARPLRCVIDEAGPTDLLDLDASGTAVQRYWRGVLVQDAKGALGDDLRAWSPVFGARAIRASVLMEYASNDLLVALGQAREMRAALPGSRLLVLHPGSRSFVHSNVAASSLARADRAESGLLARAAG